MRLRVFVIAAAVVSVLVITALTFSRAKDGVVISKIDSGFFGEKIYTIKIRDNSWNHVDGCWTVTKEEYDKVEIGRWYSVRQARQ